MKADDLVSLGIAAAVVYGIYKLFGPNSPGKHAADFVGSVVADFYTWAVLQRHQMGLLGNIVLPDGTLVPLADVNLDVRQSPGGPVVLAYAGHFYQLFPSDSNGNWPSALIQ